MRFIPRVTPYIIGEIGACHENSLDEAIRLIGIAEGAGCHAVKFQAYDAKVLSERRNIPRAHEMYLKYQLPLEWLPQLKRAARSYGVELVLSVFHVGRQYEAAVKIADIIKISSFESGDASLVMECATVGKPLIISTGLSTSKDMTKLRVFRGGLSCPVALLHCVSAYPAPQEELQLSTIRYKCLDGYSDHSGHVLAGAMAVAAGAGIIEVHIRNNDTSKGNPDYCHALDPAILQNYIEFAQKAKLMMGTPRMGLTPSEQGNAQYKVKPVEV